ncbi:hypothetical protein ES703_06907 [subsurface metagenome]
MKDIKLRDGKRILIIESDDINKKKSDLTHLANIQKLFLSCRSSFDVVIILVSSRSGCGVLPRWMRDSPLKPHRGQMSSCWMMELDDQLRWV